MKRKESKAEVARLTAEDVNSIHNLNLFEQYRRSIVTKSVWKKDEGGSAGDLELSSGRKRKKDDEGVIGEVIGPTEDVTDVSGQKGEVIDRKTMREINSRIEQGFCANHSCKSKKVQLRQGVCTFNHCFMCCFMADTKRVCEGHSASSKKRDYENEMIIEALIGEKKRKFRHFEEKLACYGQTVLIWSTKDFVQNKKWSEETMAQMKKLERYAARNSRMNSFVGEEQLLSKALSSKAPEQQQTSRPDISRAWNIRGLNTSAKKGAVRRYTKLCEAWKKKHTLQSNSNRLAQHGGHTNPK